MQQTSSEILNAKTFLNSNISEESNFFSMLLELKKIDPELTRSIVPLKEDTVRAHFLKHAKNFTPYTYINFVTGFVLI